MVGVKSTTTTTTTDQMSYIRKIRKPMVEKQRRERMNNSITQLKSLIAQTIKQRTVPMTRVDKADILELTVYHLTQLQQQQQSVSLATEAAAYRAGYSACAREAVTYLTNTKMTGPVVTRSLGDHLHRTVSQQHPAHRNGNYFHHSGVTRHTDRLSTPLRPCDIFNSPLPEMNLSGYSPIQDGSGNLPELTSSFVCASLNSSSSTDVSSSYSSISVTSIGSNQSVMSCKDDVREEQFGINHDDDDTGVVTIGDGKENEIGHVIKDALWRPF